MVSDPGGGRADAGSEMRRYRFGTGTTDFLFSGPCGIYVGAVAELDGRTYATLNLNAFDDPHRDLAATPVSYDGGRPRRSRAPAPQWTPARAHRKPDLLPARAAERELLAALASSVSRTNSRRQ